MKTDIVTVCTSNYFEVLEKMLPSWLQCPSVGNIIVYTDDLELERERVRVMRGIPLRGDWTQKVGFKPKALLHYLEGGHVSDHFIFLDADVLVADRFEEVWQRPFDVGVTRLYDALVTRPVYSPQYPATVNAGVLFFRRTTAAIAFVQEWERRQEVLKAAGRIRENGWCYDQLALHDLCVEDALGPRRYRILDLDNTVYNSEHHFEKEWILSIRIKAPKFLHFKRRRWENPELSGQVFEALGAHGMVVPRW